MHYLCFGIPQENRQVVTIKPEKMKNARQNSRAFWGRDRPTLHQIKIGKFVVKKMSDKREHLIEIFTIDTARESVDQFNLKWSSTHLKYDST